MAMKERRKEQQRKKETVKILDTDNKTKERMKKKDKSTKTD